MMMLAKQGTEAVAAYGAAQRIESILIIVLMSLTSALTPFMAQNFGANNPQRSFKALCSKHALCCAVSRAHILDDGATQYSASSPFLSRRICSRHLMALLISRPLQLWFPRYSDDAD